jgi:C4-dicarboxylate-specific signal transduction histidine kinase
MVKFGLKHICPKIKQNVCISVKDSGCGIADNIKEKIIEPFFTTKEVGEEQVSDCRLYLEL